MKPNITPRRNFLVGAVAMASATVTLPIDAHAGTDPVFAAIEAHKRAEHACALASAEINRILALAEETVGPRSIQVTDMREPSSPPGFHPLVKVDCWSEIEQYVPPELHPVLHKFYKEQLDERTKVHAEFVESISPNGDLDSVMGDELPAALWRAEEQLADTVPTTTEGLLALIVHLAEMARTDTSGIVDEQILPKALISLAKAAANLQVSA